MDNRLTYCSANITFFLWNSSKTGVGISETVYYLVIESHSLHLHWTSGPCYLVKMFCQCLRSHCWAWQILTPTKDGQKIILSPPWDFLYWYGRLHHYTCTEMKPWSMSLYWLPGKHLGPLTNMDYRKVSNIRRTKSQNLNVSRLILKVSLPNPLKPGVKLRMK